MDPKKRRGEIFNALRRLRRLLDQIAERPGRTEECLGELKTVELIYEKSLFPEPAYLFRHALTQEVAYNSLLVHRRRELHHLIGVAIEELYTDRLAEQYELLAYAAQLNRCHY